MFRSLLWASVILVGGSAVLTIFAIIMGELQERKTK